MIKLDFGLHLFPVGLGSRPDRVIPEYVLTHVRSCTFFLAENTKSARAYLKEISHPAEQKNITVLKYDKNTEISDIPALFMEGHDKAIGFLSEAGLPAVADPGYQLVRYAHNNNIRVFPYVGPSSLMLALMASGLTGENFSFNSYLPINKSELKNEIKQLSQLIKKTGQTQLFIETPYRNERLFDQLLSHGLANHLLCIAVNLTLPNEYIMTRTIAEWRNSKKPKLHKEPCVFILGRQ